MYKKILISGVTAAAIVGAGGTAMAVSGSNTTSGTATGSTASSSHSGAKSGKHKGRHALGVALRQVEHGQIVTRSKKHGTVTHDLIRGTVSKVVGASIIVTAADGTVETYVMNKDTKVRVRNDGKGAAGSINEVKAKDQVMVVGTGTSKLTAKHIVDVKGAKTHVKK